MNFLVLVFLFVSVASAGTYTVIYQPFPPSNACLDDNTPIHSAVAGTNTYTGNGNLATISYTFTQSVDGGSASPLTLGSDCPTTFGDHGGNPTSFLCDLDTTFAAGADYINVAFLWTSSRQSDGLSGTATRTYWRKPAIIISATGATCAGNDGEIEFTVTAGYAGHTANSWSYSVNGGAAVPLASAGPVTVSGLAAGDYSVTITNTDGSACDATSETVTVAAPYIPTFTTEGHNPSCPGATDGSIDVTVTNAPAKKRGGPTVDFQYSINDGAWVGSGTSHTFSGLAAGTHNIKVREVEGCEAGPEPVTLTDPVAPVWSVEYDCAANQLVFSGAGAGDLTEYKVDGQFGFRPISESSGPLTDSDTPYTVVVKYGTCEDRKEVTVACVHHCALSPGYWKNQGSWFNTGCQHFANAQWCGFPYWDLLTKTPSSIPAASRAKFIAGRQYVAFVLTLYYYSDPQVDVRTFTTVAQFEALGVPTLVAEAALALSEGAGGCSLTSSQYTQYGSALSVFNSHVVDDIYVENVECNPKISAPSCSTRSLVKQLRQK